MTDLQAAAAALYAENLQRNAEALDYLGSRGISADMARRLGLGLAEDRWRGLCDELNRRGYADRDLVRAGLGMTTSRGTIVDRLRRRIVFPIRDADRQLVAFTGRAAPGSSDSAPRWLDTFVDRGAKSRILQGLGDGRRLLEQGAVPVLCEGAFDRLAVTISSAGRFVGLAPGGTALTAQHVAALARVVDLEGRRVVVAFDTDEAGQRAALRAFPLLRAAGAIPEVASLPDRTDPGDLAVRAPQRLLAALQRTTPLEDRVVDDVLAQWAGRTHELEGLSGALHAAARVVVDLPDPARQVARLSTALHVPPSTVTGALLDVMDAAGPVARARAPGPALRAG